MDGLSWRAADGRPCASSPYIGLLSDQATGRTPLGDARLNRAQDTTPRDGGRGSSATGRCVCAFDQRYPPVTRYRVISASFATKVSQNSPRRGSSGRGFHRNQVAGNTGGRNPKDRGERPWGGNGEPLRVAT